MMSDILKKITFYEHVSSFILFYNHGLPTSHIDHYIDPGRVGSEYIYCGSGRIRVHKVTSVQPWIISGAPSVTLSVQALTIYTSRR